MRCAECGFAGSSTPAELGSLITEFAAQSARTARPHAYSVRALRRRPSPEVWSALEYMAHTRDVFEFYRDCIARTRREAEPVLAMIEWESQAEIRAWNDEEPTDVVRTLGEAATRLTALLSQLSPDEWDRVSRSEGDPAKVRTVRLFADRCAHEAQHHLLDLRRVLTST